jgi:hypothetical protein
MVSLALSEGILDQDFLLKYVLKIDYKKNFASA